MDLMEASQLNAPVILLQTVLEEVRHRSLPLYNRLRALVKAEDKQFWVYYNEFRRCVESLFLWSIYCHTYSFSETACVRLDGETPNDRNDRSIRKATDWYKSHISQVFGRNLQGKSSLPTVLLLTDDAANRKFCDSEGIPNSSGTS